MSDVVKVEVRCGCGFTLPLEMQAADTLPVGIQAMADQIKFIMLCHYGVKKQRENAAPILKCTKVTLKKEQS